jgi:hypothetical protein
MAQSCTYFIKNLIESLPVAKQSIKADNSNRPRVPNIPGGGHLLKHMQVIIPAPDLFNLEGEQARRRHYYIGDDLEDLASAERGLEYAAGTLTCVLPSSLLGSLIV